jgi:cobalt-zinc-cadmium efflux system membrane fusion protein
MSGRQGRAARLLGGIAGAAIMLGIGLLWAGSEHDEHDDHHGHNERRGPAPDDRAPKQPARNEPTADGHGHDEQGHDEHGHDAPAARRFTIADFERHGVRLATAEAGEVDLGVELPGEVRPNADRLAHIAPRFPGIVREVRRQVGDGVAAGDVLAVVESENLARYDVKAAFDGIVIDKHIAPGEVATRDEAAFIVADLSTVWVDIAVYQTALPQVRVGRPVSIRGHGGLDATGEISYVAPIVDQATRTARARVVLPNPDGRWRPGLFVTATVFDPVRSPIAVPRQAIQTLEGRPVVFVAQGEHLAARPVTLGRTGRTKVEITRGLEAGERLAVENTFLVKADLAKGEAAHAH